MGLEILTLFNSILQKKKTLGVDHLALSGLIRSRREMSYFNGKLNAAEIADEIKIGIWVGLKGRWATASVELAREDRILAAVENCREASRFNDPDPEMTLSPPATAGFSHETDPSIAALTMKDLESFSRDLEAKAKAHSPLVTNVPHAGVGYDVFTRVFENSEGAHLEERNGLLMASLSIMASGSDRRTVNCHESLPFLSVANFRAEDVVREVGGEAVLRTNPKTPPSGQRPVLFDPRTSAQLLATFSGAFSGDLLYRKLTRLEGKLGQKIASETVSIQDSGRLGLVPHFFDAEGSPCMEKAVVAAGIFREFLHNRYTGRKAGGATTGNAGGGSDSLPAVSPANIRWEGKGTSRQQLLAAFPKMILVKELHGASASPISGDFSYGAVGYWVEDGEIRTPVADFTIAGNFFDLLSRIQGLGDDLVFFSPHLLGSYGGRSLLVDSLNVSG